MTKKTAILKSNKSTAKKATVLTPKAITKDRKISPAKAAQLRKAAIQFDLQFAEGYEALKITKNDLDNAKEAVKNKLDSLSELGEMESLRLQMAMDRLSKMMSTLSNLLKKISDTASTITQNLK